VTESGLLYSWGGGHSGKPVLGHGGTADQLTPRLVDAFKGKEVVGAACGWDHSCAVLADGSVYTWGDGTCNYDSLHMCSCVMSDLIIGWRCMSML
jgi:alpha-tubulin suppressor-like RCC1 family protein